MLKYFALFVVAAIFGSCFGAPAGNETLDADCPRILNGRVADANKYPYQVSIQQRVPVNQFLEQRRKTCGGVILNKNWILTAAHCFQNYKDTKDLFINAGVLKADSYEGSSQYIPIAAAYFPSDFNSNNYFLNDIAVVKLGKPLVFNAAVQPIPIAPIDYEPAGCAEIIGWGLTDGSNEDSAATYLMTAQVNISPLAACAAEHTMSGHQVCIGFRDKTGACRGDSGGPLVQYFAGKPKLIGVTSFGTPDCRSGHPSVYTKVGAYTNWVNDVMRQNDQAAAPPQFYNYPQYFY